VNLIAIELRRCFARRLVWVLIGLAVLATAFAGYMAWHTRDAARAGDLPSARAEQQQAVETCMQQRSEEVCLAAHPLEVHDRRFEIVELWMEGSDQLGVIAIPATFLVIGAVLGGASMVGAEWRAGTFTTLLAWEPRRIRVVVAKIVAPGLAAAAIAIALEAVFCLSLLPATAAMGTADGMDARWFGYLCLALVRVGVLCGLAASLAASFATIGRSTAVPLGIVFAYLVVVENVVRAWKPWTSRFLVTTNAARFLANHDLWAEPFRRSSTTAAATLLGVVVAAGAAAALVFRRRDVGTSA
jgi:hypothetical protein